MPNGTVAAPGDAGAPSTLVDLLRHRARHQPGQVAYVFLHDGEEEASRVTYRELDRQARSVARRLAGLAAAGDRAVLVFAPGLECLTAFFGCLYAGVVAVPCYPPRPNQAMSALGAVAADCGAVLGLTTAPVLAGIERRTARDSVLGRLPWLAVDRAAGEAPADFAPPALTAGSLAFLQYTSGSTGTPRGVMLSHANLLHNERMIRSSFGHTERSVVVGWLPLFHDMGLIGNVLQPLYLGATCVLMPPVAFLQRPVRWLRAISRYGATTSGGPNFAYELCARAIAPEQKAGLDLGTWDLAFSGAEPVRAETIDRFTAAFAPSGFRREAFYPCYGLAEATLFVTGGRKAAPPVLARVEGRAIEEGRAVETARGGPAVRTVVGCGRPWLGQEVAVVDPGSLTRCPPGGVGEVWVSGPSVGLGYWNRPQETERTFRARLADTGEGPFLRTGDLGFLCDGELFVTGRLKDVIIVRGRNYAPEDIEATAAASHPALRPGGGAAFGIEVLGEERLAVVHEVERGAVRALDADEVIGGIRQAVTAEYAIQPHAVVLVKPGSVPRTSSGKVRRGACRAAYLGGALETLDGGRAALEGRRAPLAG